MSLKKSNKENYIRGKLLSWYRNNARILPWRAKNKNKHNDPYHTFVSEFMLQQTTVNAVIPKFNEFVKFWPSLKKFSTIRESTILKFWAGLGYYTRARNLLKSIKIIRKKYNYLIPQNYNDLIELPGVGDYTAKAVLGIAFNQPVMPVDANIKRIIKRIYGIKNSNKKEKYRIKNFAESLVSKKNSNNFIQALMDYGSSICVPNMPKCYKCIINTKCITYQKKISNDVLNKRNIKKIKNIKYTRAYILLNEVNQFLIRRRPNRGMLQSMLEVPNDLWMKNKKNLSKDPLIKSYQLKLTKIKDKIIYSFNHFDLHIEIYLAKVKKTNFKNYNWVHINNIDKSGMPTIMKKIAKTCKYLV